MPVNVLICFFKSVFLSRLLIFLNRAAPWECPKHPLSNGFVRLEKYFKMSPLEQNNEIWKYIFFKK